jgi:hypothetical protein
MRLKQHLNEAIIKPKISFINSISDKIDTAYTEFQGLAKDIASYKEREKVLKWDLYTKIAQIISGNYSIGEIVEMPKHIQNQVWIETRQGTHLTGETGVDFFSRASVSIPVATSVVFINPNSLVATFSRTGKGAEYGYRQFRKTIRELLAHELTHAGQLLRLAQAKTPEEFEEILKKDLGKFKLGPFVTDFDKYLADQLEVMAFAKGAASELWDTSFVNVDFMDLSAEDKKKKLLDMLKKSTSHPYLSIMSKSFSRYAEKVGWKKMFPKTWKKFLRYLTDYINSISESSIEEARKAKFRGLIIAGAQGEAGRRKLKFTKKNIEKIAYEYDAKIEKIEMDIKHAKLRDHLGRVLFVDEV